MTEAELPRRQRKEISDWHDFSENQDRWKQMCYSLKGRDQNEKLHKKKILFVTSRNFYMFLQIVKIYILIMYLPYNFMKSDYLFLI